MNMVVDRTKCRKLTAVDLDNQLKKIGILSEEKGETGRSRTVLNSKSGKYGIETVMKTNNGVEYEAIVFNDAGKAFLINNLERIMEYQQS